MTRVTRLQPALVAGNDLSELPDKALSRQNLGAQRRLTNTGVKTSAYTAVDGDFVLADATSGAFTITLPAANVSGQTLAVKKVDTSTNAITVQRAGSDTINASSTTVTLSLQDEVLTFTSNGAGQWWISGGQKSLTSLDGRYAPIGVDIGTRLTPTLLSGALTIGVFTPWGITAAGVAYYDDSGAAAGEEAYPIVATDGTISLVSLGPVMS